MTACSGTAGRRHPSGPATGPSSAATGPVAAAFVVLGMFWGSWAVSIADVQRSFHLSDGALGLLLAVAIAVAGATGAVVSHHGERWGTGPMLTGSLAVWAVVLVGAGLARPWPVFAVCFCVAEAAGGCVDAGMNAAASRRLAGRPGALVRFHSLFNTGALSGAALAGVVIGLGASWRWLWPVLAVVVAAVAVWAHRTQATAPLTPGGTTPAPGPGPGGPEAPGRPRFLAQLRADGLLVFLAVFALAEIAEGGVDTWGVLYLRTHLAAGVLLGAGAYVVGQSVAAATRGAGGPLLGRLSARRALVVGGLLAAGGILVESLSPAAVAAAGGLAAGAAGASLFWPLVMSQATRQATRATSAVGAFTAAGYVGWVAGAPVVGWVSDTWGPARGLQLLAALALAVVVASLLRRDRRGAGARAR
ncbi:MAG: MFS transporter [Acidimicrobiales bacterium]